MLGVGSRILCSERVFLEEKCFLSRALVDALNDFSFEFSRLRRCRCSMDVSSVIVTVVHMVCETVEVTVTPPAVVSGRRPLEREPDTCDAETCEEQELARHDKGWAFVLDVRRAAAKEDCSALKFMLCIFVSRCGRCPLQRCPFIH